MHLRDSFGMVRGSESLARSQALRRTWPFVLDLVVAVFGLACFYGIVRIGRYWFGHPIPAIEISLSPRALPLYAFYSVVRIGLAYLLSLAFAIGYGYTAHYSKRLEALMLAALDILQSIPVLSFLPGVMLAMVALFPTRQVGVEFGAILLIFTGAVWNMAFSFYSSLKSIPKELREATEIYRFSRLQRLLQLELPYAAIGLIWNSIMSVAGAWFFLIACEMFRLGDRDFRLPGLGSYLQTAASAGNARAITWGLVAILAIVVLTDQIIWRPVIAWSDRFKFEQVEGKARVRSPLLHLIQNSRMLQNLGGGLGLDRLEERHYRSVALRRSRSIAHFQAGHRPSRAPGVALRIILVVGVLVFAGSMALHALTLLHRVHLDQLLAILKGALFTFLRVNAALLLASAWTIPVGVAIGFQPRLARIAQPLAQIAASVPASALFPVLLLGLLRVGGGMGTGSIALMLLGTQWYILFNVIAGAMAIPSDLKEVGTLFRFKTLQRWRTIILPGIFPFLITGLVTASGGAWNASIISEYFLLKGRVLQTTGLGAQISQATADGDSQALLLATIIMAIMVVTINRLVWRPLYRLAETRYRL